MSIPQSLEDEGRISERGSLDGVVLQFLTMLRSNCPGQYGYPLISIGKAAVADKQALRNVIINILHANYLVEISKHRQ